MNCRAFEHQVGDWQAGLLASDRAQQMDDHRRVCAPCARAAAAEDRLRAAWRVPQSAEPPPDIWPRIAERLRLEAAPTHGIARRPLRLALNAGLLAGMLTLGGLWWHSESASTPNPAATAPARQSASGASRLGTATWLALSDVSQVNPAIDDPTGASMEHIWNQINSSEDADSSGR